MPDLQADREKVLAALEGAARPLSRTEISYDVFGRNRTMKEIDAMLNQLATEGLVRGGRIDGDGHRDKPVMTWEVISSVARNGNGTDEVGAPPPGEGWLPKTATLRRAETGVMPAAAERKGKSIRAKAAKKAKEEGRKVGKPFVSDEARGAAHFIRLVYLNYLRQGVIEVQGDWIRLVKNPPRRPPRSWHAAFLQFVAEGHPTLDGKWHRKPKALIPYAEDLLKRQLRPDESVMRRRGRAGSWNPADIIVASDDGVHYLSELIDIQLAKREQL